MASTITSAWSREGRPTWLDIVTAAFALVYAVWRVLTVETVSWWWVAAGFVTTVLVIGPAAASAIGTRIGEWFRVIGVEGRVIAIVAFVAVAWAADAILGVPATPQTNFVIGSLFAIAVITAIEPARRVASRS